MTRGEVLPRAVVAGLGVLLGVAVGVPLARLTLELDGPALASLLEPAAQRAMASSVALAVGATAVATALGVGLGVLVARTDLVDEAGAARLRPWLTIPYVLPPYVTALGWLLLLNPTTGWLFRGLDPYSLGGMIGVLGLEHAPLVFLATVDALGRMDGSLEEQARIAGCGPVETLRRVTLPLVAPSVLAATSFVASSAAAAYGVPYLLAAGASEPTFVLTTRIAQALDLDPATGRGRAVASSLALLAIGVVAPALAGLWLRAGGGPTVRGKVSRPAPLRLGRARALAWAAVGAYGIVGAALPLGALAVASVSPSLGAVGELTGRNYARLLSGPAAEAGIRSLVTAGAAAAVAVVLGAAIAWAAERTEAPGRRALAALARLPYAVPGTVLALGLLLAFSQPIRLVILERVTVELALADTAWMLGLAWVVKYLALPVGTTSAALRAIDGSLEEAARLAGASPATAVRTVLVPLLLPSLRSAFVLVFLPAFSEITMATLLAGPRTPVLGTLLFERQTYGDPPGAAALAIAVAAVALGLQALARPSPKA